MGFDNTFVVARWDRPLIELTVNERLAPASEPDPGLSWARDDGWQCFAPLGGYYDGELVSPVLDIAAQTGGPVLGVGVARSDHYRVSFVEARQLRTIACGPYEDVGSEAVYREMVRWWGQPWQARAAASLQRWAAPVGTSYVGLFGALAVEQVFAQRTVFDLLDLLSLVPVPTKRPWWSRDIPGAAYAVSQHDMNNLRLNPPPDAASDRDMVLAFTDDGAGVWSQIRSSWHVAPSRNLAGVIHDLGRHLRRQGWQAQP